MSRFPCRSRRVRWSSSADGRTRRRRGKSVGDRRSRIEGREAIHVLEQQRCAIEPLRCTGSGVRIQQSRAIEVEQIEPGRECQHLHERHAVGRRPRPELRDFECAVLGRQRVTRDVRVHAVRIGIECRPQRCGQQRQRPLGRATNTDCPQLDVTRQRASTEQFRQRALRLTTADVHLKQSIARVGPALQEQHVAFVLREYMGDAIVVANDLADVRQAVEPRDQLSAAQRIGCLRRRTRALSCEHCRNCDRGHS